MEAINKWVVVQRVNTNKPNTSGIYLPTDDNSIVGEYLVTATTEETKALQGKTIFAPRQNVLELTRELDTVYNSVHIDNIIAIKD